MTAKLESCPAPETLTDFLLGKLPSSEIESCEQHLADCEPCGDTIRGLKVDDTLSNLTREALLAQCESEQTQSEPEVVERLIAKMQNFNGTAALLENQSARSLEGRTAEVQRLLQAPAEEGDLGLLGPYRLVHVLGAGSTGVVYRAVDQRLQRAVALKILRPSLGNAARERFVAEARATAALEHPNVVTIYEVGTEGPLAYIAMQWLAGETLEEKLEASETLPVEKVQQLAIQIAEGLTAAHEQNLIHRDIKPANIWMPQDESGAKILDFGLVRITDEDPQLTCTGMIAGTPCYMSPEQSRGQKLDGRSDLFSLGCLMYQSLVGRLPFRSDNALATLQSIQRDQPAPLNELDPSISNDVSELVMCLLAKTPNRRPPTANAVVAALQSERRDWSFDVSSSFDLRKTDSHSDSKSTGWWKTMAALLACLAFGFAGMKWGDQITRIVTNQGVIEIETNIAGVKIDVVEDKSGKVVTVDAGTGKIEVAAGKYSIRPSSDSEEDSITIENNSLTLTRGGKAIVVIKRKDMSGTLRNQIVRDFPIANEVDESDSMVRDLLGLSKLPYTLDSGDTLGIFIEGVLGKFDGEPPIQTPPPGSGLPPAIGFPIQVDGNGGISLPLIEPIQARGKTVTQMKEELFRAYTGGDEPILRPEEAKILVSMIQRHDYVPPALNTAASATETQLAILPPTGSLQMHEGDVLGIFVDGILGQFGSDPPVYYPPASTGLPPVLGFPILIEGGKLSLPLISKVDVDGMTISQIKDAVEKAYKTGSEPILKEEARIFVGLIYKRNSKSVGGAKKSAGALEIRRQTETLSQSLMQLEIELAEQRQRLGQSHPEIKSLREQIKYLKDYLRKLDPKAVEDQDEVTLTPKDPSKELARETVKERLVGTWTGHVVFDEEKLAAFIRKQDGAERPEVERRLNELGETTFRTRYTDKGQVIAEVQNGTELSKAVEGTWRITEAKDGQASLSVTPKNGLEDVFTATFTFGEGRDQITMDASHIIGDVGARLVFKPGFGSNTIPTIK